jgi:Head domain of trimeric autotransporter adhesin
MGIGSAFLLFFLGFKINLPITLIWYCFMLLSILPCFKYKAMKKQLYSLILLLPLFVQAQNVGIGTITPHPNAMLDISGTNKGLLIPRGDAATRTALIGNTAKGLLMYDTLTANIWVHNGITGWEFLSIGKNYWVQNGALGTEIKNTNTGGFWSANFAAVTTDPGIINPPVSGAGSRLMWMPGKSAFRAGTVLSSEWDAANIGLYSFASGGSNIASGYYSTALGVSNVASGFTSTALGFNTKAIGGNSIAMGDQTTAIGNASASMGYNTTASGEGSTAMGVFTKATGRFSTAMGGITNARSYSSLAIGQFNDSIASSNLTDWVNADPVFYVGNGTSNFDLHNAMVVYKNGNMLLKNPTTVSTDPVGFTLPISGTGTRMMWLPEKSAFRVGTVMSNRWDAVNIGLYSFASGRRTLGSGLSSTAMGDSTIANGPFSTAIGHGTTASGSNSTAMGFFTTASAGASTAMGQFTSASATSSTAMGEFTNSSGSSSTAMGEVTNSRAYVSLAIGRYNDTIASASKFSWQDTDPLFYIGNGTFNNTRHNAMVVYKNGNMVMKNPTEVIIDPIGFTVPISGAGTRMMWLPEKSAFRVGTIGSTQWDAANIGLYSFASGRRTLASGLSSTAMGDSTLASGAYSFAMGQYDTASGFNSVAMGLGTVASGSSSLATGFYTTASGGFSNAMGNNSLASGGGSTSIGQHTIASGSLSTAMGNTTTASGFGSTSMGEGTVASGTFATAMGFHTVAKAYSSVAIGRYNDSIATSSKIVWIDTDPLLILGNGTSNTARSNALIVLKNGNTGIGISTPGTNKLDVNGNTQTDSLQVGSGTKFSKMQAGTFVAGGGAAQSKQVTIIFPTAFITTPKMIVTPRNEAGTNNNDVYAVTVRSISTTSAVINILRVDFAAGWGQNLQLDWEAWTQ